MPLIVGQKALFCVLLPAIYGWLIGSAKRHLLKSNLSGSKTQADEPGIAVWERLANKCEWVSHQSVAQVFYMFFGAGSLILGHIAKHQFFSGCLQVSG